MSKRFWNELNDGGVDVHMSQTLPSFAGTRKKVKKVTISKKSYGGKSRGGLASAVKSVLASSAEKKTIGKVASAFVGGGNFATNTNFYVTPDASAMVIAQGTGVSSRIGNRIQTTKCRLKGHFAPGVYNASTNGLPSPVIIKVYVLSSKDQPTVNVNPSTAGVPFYRTGATTFKMNGAIFDPYTDINLDAFTVHKTAMFKVGYAAFVENPGQSTGVGYYTNNDASICAQFDFDLTPYIPKHIDFNDTTALPTSRAVYVVCEATPMVTATGNSQPAIIYYDIKYDFVDV
jgi:hypothetical protein